MVVVTHKDLVKLPFDKLGDAPLWALVVEMQLTVGAEALEDSLRGVLRLTS
jgi:hypothetical protein